MNGIVSIFLTCVVFIVRFSYGAELWSWDHETHNKDINDVLRDSFDYTNHQGQFGLGADDSLSIAEDPEHSGQYVMRVFYKKGTYSGHDSNGDKCQSGQKCHRGAQFYSTPHALSHSTHLTMTLQYEVYFDASFSWNRGGKLPGLFGGERTCSGGRIGDACFSTRLMWRPWGDGEVYAYVTHNQDPSFSSWCSHYESSSVASYEKLHCTTGYGVEFGRASFRFHHSRWHKVRQEVHLNSQPGHKGYIKLWIDDTPYIHHTDVIMRDNTNFDIDGIFFSTFYGGSDSSWACPRDTYTYYRNFRLSTDTQTIIG
ncbi:hypothetical protein ACF0H5_008665 [Mactra antiquata]